MNNSDEQEGIAEIKKLHQELQELAAGALDRAIRLGELLSKAKKRVPHGQWLAWLTTNGGFSERTARNYMRVFENRATLKSANVADLAEAYQMLVGQSQRAIETNSAPMTKEEAEWTHKALIRTMDAMLESMFEEFELQREYPQLLNLSPETAATVELLAKSQTEKEFRHHFICQILRGAGLADEADRLPVSL